jgi:hypothetical protein
MSLFLQYQCQLHHISSSIADQRNVQGQTKSGRVKPVRVDELSEQRVSASKVARAESKGLARDQRDLAKNCTAFGFDLSPSVYLDLQT